MSIVLVSDLCIWLDLTKDVRRKWWKMFWWFSKIFAMLSIPKLHWLSWSYMVKGDKTARNDFSLTSTSPSDHKDEYQHLAVFLWYKFLVSRFRSPKDKMITLFKSTVNLSVGLTENISFENVLFQNQKKTLVILLGDLENCRINTTHLKQILHVGRPIHVCWWKEICVEETNDDASSKWFLLVDFCLFFLVLHPDVCQWLNNNDLSL